MKIIKYKEGTSMSDVKVKIMAGFFSIITQQSGTHNLKETY